MPPSFDNPPATLAELKDALDDLLEDYLDTLSAYQQARDLLSSHLKTGYFDLARAKVALGPGRVGQSSYDLGENESLRVVTIEGEEEVSQDKGVKENGRISCLRYLLDLRPASPESARDVDSSSNSPATLRRRTTAADGRPDPSTPDTTSSSAPTRTRPHVSPLAQFSAFPPPALRSSADAFGNAVEAAVRCVECEARVRDRAREVKRMRKRVERAEKEAMGGEVVG
ncbi:hypothetical protein NBRC10512_006123 [Rhodotorula toruloides]|uniref:Vacuolar ATPase assembly protein VMA22 n=2 Tax=Rhodotorula toruloides TaxID=5286 RepID=A0A061B4U3_RHOTO|nr:uncharacterized protein RHTO_05856 [Rhodotorula toruloides NP11]EMS18604.1 hypothetical protein RHTO_05856 [Rhodotorula toruloides NP11]CDR44839.1 RHTO0S10e01640g1_1 [Rhodotorula toruloides]